METLWAKGRKQGAPVIELDEKELMLRHWNLSKPPAVEVHQPSVATPSMLRELVSVVWDILVSLKKQAEEQAAMRKLLEQWCWDQESWQGSSLCETDSVSVSAVLTEGLFGTECNRDQEARSGLEVEGNGDGNGARGKGKEREREKRDWTGDRETLG